MRVKVRCYSFVDFYRKGTHTHTNHRAFDKSNIRCDYAKIFLKKPPVFTTTDPLRAAFSSG